QQAVLASGLAQKRRVVFRFSGATVEGDQADLVSARAHRVGRSVVGRVVEDEHLALVLRWMRALDRVEAAHEELAPVRVDHAVRDQHWPAMMVRSCGYSW